MHSVEPNQPLSILGTVELSNISSTIMVRRDVKLCLFIWTLMILISLLIVLVLWVSGMPKGAWNEDGEGEHHEAGKGHHHHLHHDHQDDLNATITTEPAAESHDG